MRKVLLEIGSIKIYSYGLMIAIAIIAGTIMFCKRGKDKKYNEDYLLNAVIISVISGLLGGKLLYILVEIKTIIKDPSILLNVGEGFVVYGGIIGGALALAIYSKIKKWNILEVFDLAVPALAIAQGIGRIGCFLAGCCYGGETDLWIGVEFPADSLAPTGVLLHPTQLYSSAFDFVLVIVLILYSRKKKRSGSVFSLYLILYSIGRFLVEFLRDDPRGAVGIFSTSQVISLCVFIGAIIFNCIMKNKGSVVKSEEKNNQ